MRKHCHLFFILLLCCYQAPGQDLIGRVTDQDSARTPLFMAEVAQIQDGKTIATYKTYFDGTYRIKVSPGQSYQLRVTFAGRSDTTVAISVDKHGVLYTGTLFISMRKDGMRLTGYILDQAQDIPIKDACIILRNVMTRKEEKYTTDVNGNYNLKMDYETNYTLRIDKMSPGILNKYQDTSFSISTIGFNKPLDFRLDIKLGPTSGYIAPRPEYDPKAKPVNRNLKPALVVLGAKDSIQKKHQDSIVAELSRKLNVKDSVIASIDKRIHDINDNKKAKVVLKDLDPEEKKQYDQDHKPATEIDNTKLRLAEEQKKKDIEKAEADLTAKKLTEKELQAKLDREIKDAEARRKQLEAKEADRKLQEINAARVKIVEDSLLKVALAQNKEMMARRKFIKDSLLALENPQAQARLDDSASDQNTKPKVDNVIKPEKTGASIDTLVASDSSMGKEMAQDKKPIVDSLKNTEGQKPQAKTDIVDLIEEARINDSIRLRQSQNLEKMRQAHADSMQAEQDSLLRIALDKNKEILSRRKYIADSLTKLENQNIEAVAEAKKSLKEKQDSELAQTKKAKEEYEKAMETKAEEEAQIRKKQLENDLAAIKKSREDAEAKLKAQKLAQKESKRIAKEAAEQAKKPRHSIEDTARNAEQQKQIAAIEKEQQELEAKKALELQEKNKLTQQLDTARQDQQSGAMKNPESKLQGNNPDQAMKNEKQDTVIINGDKTHQQNTTQAASTPNPAQNPRVKDTAKLIKATGYVKNGQTETPISNVSINIRRLNSIVSQEVTSDQNGRYDILVDSGYFYLVSYYKDRYEISKQILDLTHYNKSEYTMAIEFLKERDDFDPKAKMPVIQFAKNSAKLPADVWGDLQTIMKMMKDIPALSIKIYGLASLDEDYPMELSVTRARVIADLVLESGIKASRIRIKGMGAYRPRSGCTEGKPCPEASYRLDRVVLYKVIKE